MKLTIIIAALLWPAISISQTQIKAGFMLGNRWSETLNSQTLGKGLRIAAEKKILPQLTAGVEVSYVSFNPNTAVNIQYTSYNLLVAYYFNTKKLQPFAGAGFGYTNYQDKTTLNLGNGIISKQARNKSYGDVALFLGIRYHVDNKKKLAIFLQGNADFVPVVNIDPIGYASLTAGFAYQL